jgi:hypothetical protein
VKENKKKYLWTLGENFTWTQHKFYWDEDFYEMLEKNKFPESPIITLGDEFNHIEIHENQEYFLFRVRIQNLHQILMVQGLPQFMDVFESLNNMLSSYFKTEKMVLQVRNE